MTQRATLLKIIGNALKLGSFFVIIEKKLTQLR